MATILHRFLDTNGDGTGTKDAIGNYASAVEIFYIQPPSDEVYVLTRILPIITDAGTFDAASYGNGITLTNGITIRIQDDDGTKVNLVDSDPIKTNVDWGKFCFDIANSSFGVGDETLHARWTFSKSGADVVLNGADNDRLELVLNDDFTALVHHKFMVQGKSMKLNSDSWVRYKNKP